MIKKEEYQIENSGYNQGLMFANNEGNINVILQQAVKIPSLISTVVATLGNICSEMEMSSGNDDYRKYTPDDKIEYNCVIKYKDIIKYYSAYYFTCEKHLNAYDDSNIRGKAKILGCVHEWYMEAKGDILLRNRDSKKAEIDIVRENSDDIIDMVKERILRAVMDSHESMYREDMVQGIACFTCFCFMECKILEKPL